jgi:hypothetical protein
VSGLDEDMIRQLQARGLLVSSVPSKTEAAPRELRLTRVAFLHRARYQG